jgi:hypothetical protein
MELKLFRRNQQAGRRKKLWSIGLLALFPLGMAEASWADSVTDSIPAVLTPLIISQPNLEEAQQRDIMPMTTSLPWGAVGFLDNGCTATLIDSRHILAASHCFTFDYNGKEANGTPYLQGGWQRGLVFFPNYHPARSNPPRVAVDRVIVGSRVQDGSDLPADWGIGHLASEVTTFPSLTIQPMESWRYPEFVRFAGYARDLATYPKGPASFPQPSPGGYCANFGGNCWWIPAFVDPRCLATESNDGFVRFDQFSCLVQGGNSGSPVLWNSGTKQTPLWKLTGVISGGAGFWDATRFEFAPRFAADVAVSVDENDTKRSQVFALDSDLSRIVRRVRRDGSSTGQFRYFEHLGSVNNRVAIAATEQSNGQPLLFVAGSSNKINVNFVKGKSWTGWQSVAAPSGLASVRDIAATASKGGVPQLFLIGSDGKLYTSQVSIGNSGVSLAPWSTVIQEADGQRLSATRHADGSLQLFVLTSKGDLRSLWRKDTATGGTWTTSPGFTNSPPLNLVDVTAGWTSEGYVRVLAVDGQGNSWSRSSTGASPSSGWSAWSAWNVPLYAPKASSPPKLDGIIALSASRWRESSAVAFPVVFALDQQGNLYVTTQEGGTWKPWRSFYN